MGENLNLMQALYITVSSMTIVFLILLLISGVVGVFKSIFKSKTVLKTATINGNNIQYKNLEFDEDEKVVVALIASIKLAENTQSPNLHIRKITRIS